MKFSKSLFVSLFLLVFVFTSCSDDITEETLTPDPEKVNTKYKLVQINQKDKDGDWQKYKSFEYNEKYKLFRGHYYNDGDKKESDQYFYNEKDQLIKIEFGEGTTWLLTYDDNGNITKMEAGSKVGSNFSIYSTFSSKYNSKNELIEQIEKSNSIVDEIRTYIHDDKGNITKETIKGTSKTFDIYYTYDDKKNPFHHLLYTKAFSNLDGITPSNILTVKNADGTHNSNRRYEFSGYNDKDFPTLKTTIYVDRGDNSESISREQQYIYKELE